MKLRKFFAKLYYRRKGSKSIALLDCTLDDATVTLAGATFNTEGAIDQLFVGMTVVIDAVTYRVLEVTSNIAFELDKIFESATNPYTGAFTTPILSTTLGANPLVSEMITEFVKYWIEFYAVDEGAKIAADKGDSKLLADGNMPVISEKGIFEANVLRTEEYANVVGKTITGLICVNADETITKIGATFDTPDAVDELFVGMIVSIDSVVYRVASITGDTEFELDAPFASANATYPGYFNTDAAALEGRWDELRQALQDNFVDFAVSNNSYRMPLCTAYHNIYGVVSQTIISNALAMISVIPEEEVGKFDTDDIEVISVFKLETPTFSPSSGNAPFDVTITSRNGSDVYLHYTTDGSAPDNTDPFIRSGEAISVGNAETLKCIAIRNGYTDSAVRTEVYT
jgi:Fn3 domain-containing protein